MTLYLKGRIGGDMLIIQRYRKSVRFCTLCDQTGFSVSIPIDKLRKYLGDDKHVNR